jgi:hypothetical protein
MGIVDETFSDCTYRITSVIEMNDCMTIIIQNCVYDTFCIKFGENIKSI